MSEEWGRAAAFRDLVAALLDARNDYATQEFDKALAGAEADGAIGPAAARLLRWWQRETLRAVVDHATRVLPTAVLAMEQADRTAAQEAEQARESIAAASSTAPDAQLDSGPDPRPPVQPGQGPTLTVVLPDTDAGRAALLAQAPLLDPTGSTGRIDRVGLRPWPGQERVDEEATPSPDVIPEPIRPAAPLASAPSRPNVSAPPAGPAPLTARRTLVAGLRILPATDHPPPAD